MTLLYNVRLVNVMTGTVQPGKAVLLSGNTIQKVGSFKALKQGVQPSRQINGQGKYLIPGLWDMHVHIEGEDLVEDNLALMDVYLAHGITTVRDCASDLGEKVLQWRDEINQGKRRGPQIFTAGRKLEGINSVWKGDIEIGNEKQLDSALQMIDRYKVDFVKITENTLPGPLFLKSVQEAKKRGYLVTGHVPIDLTIDELAEAGFSAIEHATYLLRLGNDEQRVVGLLREGKLAKAKAAEVYSTNFDQTRAIEGYKRLAQKGVAVTPTIIGGRQLAYLDRDNHQNDDFQQYLTQRFTDKYRWRIERMAGETPEQTQRRKDQVSLLMKQLPLVFKAGVLVLAGSDAAALNTFVYPALSLHQELEIFQEAGVKQADILKTAILNGPAFLGKSARFGGIEAGKEADLVLLNQNPLVNIKATQDIFAVVNNGIYYNRQALDEMLAQARQTKLHLDGQRKKQ
ncbi:MAG: amidohydrolase family protein [Spirosomataceae bacterium]